MKKIIILGMFILALYGCSNVQPWERGILAKPKMSLSSDNMIDSINDHMYFSREASSGGKGFAGGGCGCN